MKREELPETTYEADDDGGYEVNEDEFLRVIKKTKLSGITRQN